MLKHFNFTGRGDEFALFKRYLKNHNTDIENIGLDSAYKIMFLEQPEFKSLDYKESIWIKRTNSKINFNKTIYKDLIFL